MFFHVAQNTMQFLPKLHTSIQDMCMYSQNKCDDFLKQKYTIFKYFENWEHRCACAPRVSVQERREMEWNGSVLEEWNGSILAFGLDKKEERNGTVFCSVGGIGEQNGTWLN